MTQTANSTSGQSGTGSNSKGVLHTPKSPRTGASIADAVSYHAQDIPFLGGESLTPQ